MPGAAQGGNRHQSRTLGLALPPQLPPRAQSPPPQTPHKAGSPWHSIFYFLELYTNVKYFNSKSTGKLFGFKLL